jgi:glycosyltransferase involved in cell wall biosynthesis
VDLRYRPDLVGPRRAELPDGRKVYSLWDAYPHADLVTYPSSYEGFGNALLEAVYFRCPVLVNRYAVYVRDIEPTGLDLVEIDGEVTATAVEQLRALLADDARRRAVTEHNVGVAQHHFSYEVLEQKLSGLLGSF